MNVTRLEPLPTENKIPKLVSLCTESIQREGFSIHKPMDVTLSLSFLRLRFKTSWKIVGWGSPGGEIIHGIGIGVGNLYMLDFSPGAPN